MVGTLPLMTTLLLSTIHRTSGFVASLRKIAQRDHERWGMPLNRPSLYAKRLLMSAVDVSCEMQLYVPSVDDMEDLGGLLATLVLEPSPAITSDETRQKADLILLDGDLGAGKTALSRGFIQTSLGDFDMPVTSPTYLLSNSYKTPEGGPEIQHMDLYRLSGANTKELRPLNLHHVFENCVALIEWPERLGDAQKQLPADRLDICLQIAQQRLPQLDGITGDADPEPSTDEDASFYDSNQMRKVILTAYGDRWKTRLESAMDDGFLDDLLEPPPEE